MKSRFLPAVAATVITAGVLAVPSLAQESGTDTPTSTESTDSASEKPDREALHAERETRYNELLAGELDVTVDELVAARESVKETLKAEMRAELVTRLDEKVAAGDITQEQADEMLARFDDGEMRPGKGRRGGPGHGPRGEGGPGGQGADDAPTADGTAA